MWGIASGASMLLTAIFAPVFGAIADTSRSKNKFLTFLTLACIFFSFLLFFLKEGMVAQAMVLFIISNFFYQTSMMFYNSFLPQLSARKNTGLISGFGFSVGYLGGLLILLIAMPFLAGGLGPANLLDIRYTFLITCIFFLIFSIPSFVILKDQPAKKAVKIKTNIVAYGFKKLAGTLRNIKKHKNLARFLISYFLFSNAFSVLALYIAIYAKTTLNFGIQEIAMLFILGQIPTIVSSIFFGWLTDKIGAKVTITITLVIWIIIVLIVTTFSTRTVFYIGWILAAISTGSTLIASRSLMTFLIPVDNEAEFFGFYSISGKVSSIIGPVTFGIISYFTKNQRLALLSTLIFLIAGLVMLQFVKVPQKSRSTIRSS